MKNPSQKNTKNAPTTTGAPGVRARGLAALGAELAVPEMDLPDAGLPGSYLRRRLDLLEADQDRARRADDGGAVLVSKQGKREKREKLLRFFVLFRFHLFFFLLSFLSPHTRPPRNSLSLSLSLKQYNSIYKATQRHLGRLLVVLARLWRQLEAAALLGEALLRPAAVLRVGRRVGQRLRDLGRAHARGR